MERASKWGTDPVCHRSAGGDPLIVDDLVYRSAASRVFERNDSTVDVVSGDGSELTVAAYV
jgi:hypothetical protein